MRGRSYSYSPSTERYRSRSYHRSPSPKRGRRYGDNGRDRDQPTSLLVRNLGRGVRPEDLRGPFGEFGPLKDVYLPQDYYTGEPRGFGFVQYLDPHDAAEAKYQMNGQILLGRELTVVFAEENRKKPSEMKARERFSLDLIMAGDVHMIVEDLLHVRPAVEDHTIAVQVIILLPLGGTATLGDVHMIVEDLAILVRPAVEDHTIAVQFTIPLLLDETATLGPSRLEHEGTEKGLIQGVHIDP